MNGDHLSLADALAFDSFTDEQKRIAYAGVELHSRIEEKLEEARVAGFDEGRIAARENLADDIEEQANKLALAIPLLPTGHTAESELRMIRRALTDLVDGLRHHG